MTWDLFLTAFVTLFLVIDPIGLVPFFIALTNDREPSERRTIALRSCGLSLILLAVFTFAGDKILSTIGIGMPAFRIAGGMLLFLIAVDMLFEKRTERRENQADSVERPDPTVFPLTTPLIVGPGAIAAVILLAGDGNDSFTALMVTLGALFGVLVLVLSLFFISGGIAKLLGKVGITVLTRLMGMLLAALAIQFVVDGILGSGLV
ncbi:MarC family protein [Amylibacter sp. IMCC11727]|uniref:MarC family protein n=1 Tax=Amylibacter sp. IMCC11727 TaxID=3039851 RepID=UPI00244E2E75|nr:MarC family protein [Amylibacter sp. IMCC11727]WGI20757.1 MarC family protein [Amylibacter sp. IMCC11727]